MTDSITILITSSGKPTAKGVGGAPPNETRHYKWRWRVEPVASLDDLERVLREVSQLPNIAIVREAIAEGAPDEILRNRKAGHLIDAPRRWLCVDIDKVQVDIVPSVDPIGAVKEAKSRLPAPLNDAECVAMISASTTSESLSCHLWYWLPSRYDSKTLKQWAQSVPGVDATAYDPMHPIFACLPRIGPAGDTLEGRRLLRLGGAPCGSLPVETGRAYHAGVRLKRGLERVARHDVRETKHDLLRDVAWSLGADIRHGYLDRDLVIELLRSAEQSSPVPRDPERREKDTERFVEEAIEKAPAALPPLERGDDVEVAGAVIEEAEHPLIWDQETWWEYREGVWQRRPKNYVPTMIHDMAGRPIRSGEKDRPLALSAGRVKGIDEIMRTMAARPRFIDAHRGAIVLRDCVLWRDGSRTPHSPDHGLQWALPYSYEELTTADRKPWVQWLDSRLQPDAWRLIAVWYGLALLGLATDAQVALVLLGEGGEGKSVLLHVLRNCAPKGSVSAVSVHDLDENRFATSSLVGRLLNIVPEMPVNILRSGARIKSIISGDEMTVDVKFRDAFNARPIAGHIFSTNELPPTDDRSHGFYRRFKIIKFRPFAGTPNPRLAEELAQHRAGILWWALSAAFEWLQSGEPFPTFEGAEAEHHQWRTDNDPVAQWVEEHFKDDDNWTRSTELYDSFSEWAEDNGFRRLTSTSFGRRMKRLIGPERCKRSDGIKYRGALK